MNTYSAVLLAVVVCFALPPVESRKIMRCVVKSRSFSGSVDDDVRAVSVTITNAYARVTDCGTARASSDIILRSIARAVGRAIARSGGTVSEGCTDESYAAAKSAATTNVKAFAAAAAAAVAEANAGDATATSFASATDFQERMESATARANAFSQGPRSESLSASEVFAKAIAEAIVEVYVEAVAHRFCSGDS